MLLIQDVYWLAGILEGEGYFGHRRNGDLLIEVEMTDRDVIERVCVLIGADMRQHGLPSGKTAYKASITNQAKAAGLMMTLLPIMGKRRAEKIEECLAAWRAKPLPRTMWTHCSHGHELSGDNLRITQEGKYTKRRCLICQRLRQQKHRRIA